MTTAKPGIKLTYEDYCNAPQDVRYELLDGELVIVPSLKEIHQRIQLAFGLALALYVQTHALGRLYFAPFDVLFTDSDVVQPDLIFRLQRAGACYHRRQHPGRARFARGSAFPIYGRDRDKDFKRGLYERHGVAEYWMVDPYAKTVTVLRLGEDGYETAAAYNEGQTLESTTLVGFTLALGDVL